MGKNVVMFPMNDEVLQNKLFEGIKMHALDSKNLTFLHVFKEVRYPYIIPPYIYPTEKEREGIKETVENLMRSMVEAKFGSASNCDFICLFGENPKEEAANFLKQKSFNSVICATKEKGNLEKIFISSFTEYMVKHSPSDVLVLR